jgi:hypothetical protein
MDDAGVVIIEGWINACDHREAVLDEDLGETNVEMTILRYPCNIAKVMSMWRWLLSQVWRKKKLFCKKKTKGFGCSKICVKEW